MAVHEGFPVVILAVHGGDIAAVRVGELGEVALQHRQAIEGEGFHAVELGVRCQKAVRVSLHGVDSGIQAIRVRPPGPCLPVVVLGDELLHGCCFAVDPAALRDAAPRVDGVDRGLGQRQFRGEQFVVCLELTGVGNEEIAGDEVGQVLVHVEAAGESDRRGQQHHGQGQRQHRDRCFAPAAAQICPGHGQQRHFFRPAPGGFPPGGRGPLRVAHGFNGGYPGRHSPGTAAGEKHRDQGKERTADEQSGVRRGDGSNAVEPRGDHRRQHTAQQPAKQQSHRDACERQHERLRTDDAPQLPGRGADGFQQPIKPDVPRHGDLKHIVDDKIPGQQDQNEHPREKQYRGEIQIFRQLCAGVGPVDPAVDVTLRRGGIALIAVVTENGVEVSPDVPGAAFERHVHVPGAGHAVPARRGDAHLPQNGVHPALRNEDVVGDDGVIRLPPAAEGEDLGGFMAVHREGHGELRPQLRLDAQKPQDLRIRGGLVGALPGETAHHRIAEHPVGVLGFGIADLHMGFVEGLLCRHPEKAPQAGPCDTGIVLQLIVLLLGEILEAAVGRGAHLTERGLLKALVDGEGDGKKRGKEHRGEGDGQRCDEIPRAVCLKTPQPQAEHAFSVGNVHVPAPLPRDDAAVLDADDAVGQLRDLLVVGDHHHRLAEALAGDLHQSQNILAGLGIEVSRGLVRQHDGRLGSKRPGDGHPLLLTAGELVRQAVEPVRKPKRPDDLAYVVLIHLGAVQLDGQHDILVHAEHGD